MINFYDNEVDTHYSNFIDLSIGDFHLPIDQNMTEYMLCMADQNGLGYTPNAGVMILREQICDLYKEKYCIENLSPENVQITVGCLHGAYLALREILTPNDEIILVSPYFPPYLILSSFPNIKVTILNSEEPNFLFPKALVKKQISRRTRAILINYPNNPTGVNLSHSDKEWLATISKNNNIWIIDDHVYSEYNTNGIYSPISQKIDHQILISSFSKNFGLTGMRIGYMIAPKSLIRHTIRLNEAITYAPPTLSQYAALYCLKNYSRLSEELVNSVKLLGIRCAKKLKTAKVLGRTEYHGGLYLFIKLLLNDEMQKRFYARLMKHYHVKVLSGDNFGPYSNYFRISLSGVEKRVLEGVERIVSCANDITYTK